VPGALINSIRQLQSGQYLKDKLASSGNPSEMFKCYSMLSQFRAPPKTSRYHLVEFKVKAIQEVLGINMLVLNL